MRTSYHMFISRVKKSRLTYQTMGNYRWSGLIVAVVAIIVMIPRLQAPYFGLLDDGVSIQTAQRVLNGDYLYPFIIGQAFGRLFPIYWYYYVPQYFLFGNNALGFFLINSISLGITAIALAAIVRQVSRSIFAGVIAGILFVLSPPIVETYYTLGKPETQLVLYLTLSIVCLITAINRSPRNRMRFFSASIALLLLGMLTKETALIVVPITICWSAAYIWFNRGKAEAQPTQQLLVWYTTAAILLALGNRLLAYLLGVKSVDAGVYSQGYRLDEQVILNSLVGELHLVARDFGFLPWVLIALAIVAWSGKQVLTDSKIHWLLGACLIWVGGWTGIMLPWVTSIHEYYLLPAALGLCAAGGLGAEMARRFWLTRSTGRKAPFAASMGILICILAALVFIVGALFNMISAGHIQIAVDRQNAALLDELARSAPNGATVLFNLAAPNEYVFEFALQMQLIKGRTDLKIDYVSLDSLAHASDSTVIATLALHNTPSPIVRIGGYGPALDTWNGLLTKLLGEHARSIYHNGEDIPLRIAANNAWLCPLTLQLHQRVGLISAQDLCLDRSIVRKEIMDYGWNLYVLQAPQGADNKLDKVGIFRPESFSWILNLTDDPNGPTRSLRFGMPTDIPIVGDWAGSGHDGIGVFRPATHEWFLDRDVDGTADISLVWSIMQPGDIPVVGDWDGDGIDTIGFFRPANSSWYLRNHNSDGPEEIPIFQFGSRTSTPIVGDWNGDGKDSIGTYRSSNGDIKLQNGNAGSAADRIFKIAAHRIPVTIAWRPYMASTVVTFANDHWILYFGDCACAASDPLTQLQFDFGQNNDIPVVGNWGGQ